MTWARSSSRPSTPGAMAGPSKSDPPFLELQVARHDERAPLKRPVGHHGGDQTLHGRLLVAPWMPSRRHSGDIPASGVGMIDAGSVGNAPEESVEAP